jgi:2-polyprenyl-3-methyl-5-hydroxy-6-metoxy-1,4-benzoquinol methylase
MDAQFPHAMLSRPSADARGRESYLAAMRRFLIGDLYAGNEVAWQQRQLPAFVAEHGHAPDTYHEVKAAMGRDPYYRAFSLLNRATQELLWDTVGESVEAQLPQLRAAAQKVPGAGGSLELDPDFELPDYARKVDIHVMPGSYHTELGSDDVYAGAVYDRGVYIYAYGELGPQNDGLGTRILDLGCGAGMSTHPLIEAFPGAQVHAVDIAAPMLRYAHARSEAIGVPIHYRQASAAQTGYADGSFDLVISNLLLHEIPQKLSRQVLAECHRLLAPGGITVHNDMVGWPEDPFQQFMAEWNSHHNNEVFERGSGTLDWEAACTDAGFAAADVFLQPIGAAYMAEQLAYVGYRGAVRQ